MILAHAEQMLLLPFRARMNNLSFEDGNGLRLCRVRFQSILSLTSFIVMNALTASVHVPAHMLAVRIVTLCVGCTSRAHMNQ